MSNNGIPTPRQTYTLKYSKESIIEKLKYIALEMPTYKYISYNQDLNTLRIEITRSFQPQHLDFRFDETISNDETKFEVEVSKHTGGMTDDDSSLHAKKNLEEIMDFLIKCLKGYLISEEDKKAAKKGQIGNMIFVAVVFVAVVWWIGSGIYW